MPVPQNKLQNVLLLGGSLILALLLAAVGSILEQPIDQSINWRLVFNDVGKTLIALSPAIIASLGLPRLGAEKRASLVNELGTDRATQVLQDAADGQGQARPMSHAELVDRTIDYDLLTDKIMERKKAEEEKEKEKERVRTYSVQRPIRTQDSASSSTISTTQM